MDVEPDTSVNSETYGEALMRGIRDIFDFLIVEHLEVSNDFKESDDEFKPAPEKSIELKSWV